MDEEEEEEDEEEEEEEKEGMTREGLKWVTRKEMRGLAEQVANRAVEAAMAAMQGTLAAMALANEAAEARASKAAEAEALMAEATVAAEARASKAEALAAQAEERARNAAQLAEQAAREQEGKRREEEEEKERGKEEVAAACLPPRVMAVDKGSRPRGGAERNPLREDFIKRMYLARGLEAEEMEEIMATMDLGQKVRPSPDSRASSLLSGVWGRGVGRQGAPDQPAPGFYQQLVEARMAPATDEVAFGRGIADMFRAQGEKAAVKEAKLSSYKDFLSKFEENGWLTRQKLEDEPNNYWAFMWVKSGVEWLNVKHDWAVAYEYYKRLTKVILRGWVDPVVSAAMEEFRVGNIRGSLHEQCYNDARHEHPAKSGGGGGGFEKKGTKNRVNPTDTWCGFHNLYYAAGDNHRWDKKAETGTCNMAKAELKRK